MIMIIISRSFTPESEIRDCFKKKRMNHPYIFDILSSSHSNDGSVIFMADTKTTGITQG